MSGLFNTLLRTLILDDAAFSEHTNDALARLAVIVPGKLRQLTRLDQMPLAVKEPIAEVSDAQSYIC